MKKTAPRIMVFGTFDGLHPGHLHFLSEAKKLGEFLIVVVGQDKAIAYIKGKLPHHNQEERVAMIKAAKLADRVLLGDAIQGQWDIIKKIKPDIIALGYDQKEIKKSLRMSLGTFSFPFVIKTITAHHGHRLHTRLLRKKSTLK